MEVSFIRHFQTQGNRERRYIGCTDESILMTEISKGQYKLYPPAEILISSPMLRCRETAELLYKRTPDLVCEKLKETDFGSFEGKNYEELKDDPQYQQWLESNGTMPFPEGESHLEFLKRSREGFEIVVEDLIKKGCNQAVFVVHGGTIMAILSGYSDSESEFYDWQIENGNGYRAYLDEDSWKEGKRKLTGMEKLW